MANYYVAKDGDPGNGATSWADAVDTHAGAVALANAAADVYPHYYVAGGIYAEQVTLSASYWAYFHAVGHVVLDRTGAPYGFRHQNMQSSWYDYTIRGATTAGIDRWGVGWARCFDCTFLDCGWAVKNTGSRPTLMYRCLVAGTNGVQRTTTYASNNSYYDSTIIATAKGFENTAGSGAWIDMQRSLLSAPTMVDVYDADQVDADYNCLDFNGGSNAITDRGTSTNYTSLAGWQAFSGQDTYSLDATPAATLLDPTKGLYGLRPSGVLVARGDEQARHIGWFGPALGISTNVNATQWNGAFVDTGSAAVNGSGNWVRTNGTVALVRFGDGSGNAMDLGGVRSIRKVRFTTTGEDNAGNIIDYDLTDTAPSQLTYRYKAADADFDITDDTGWIEVNRSSDLLLANRYLAIEVPLRGSAELLGIEIQIPGTFSDEFPLTSVVAGGTKSRYTKSVGTKGVVH